MAGRCRDDLREMKVKKWRQKENSKENWASVLQESKVLRGTYNQGISKQIR
jgi:hypothetical protein